jgi:septum formation inhibitor MinC
MKNRTITFNNSIRKLYILICGNWLNRNCCIFSHYKAPFLISIHSRNYHTDMVQQPEMQELEKDEVH